MITKIKNFAVLISCHNRRKKTLNCLNSLYTQKIDNNSHFNVFLVDDGSTDNTGDSVRAKYPKVNIIKGDGFLFWCGGMRLAWTKAMRANYDAYLWLNDDVNLLPNALCTMLDTAEKICKQEGQDGIVVGSCCDPETGQHTYGGRIKRGRLTRLPDQPLPPSERILPCDTMNGNLVLIPKGVADKLGNLSEPYIHAFGDTDYGMRATKRGIPVRVAPGYLGSCAANNRRAPWTDPAVSLSARWKDMCSPRGLPPKHWLFYVQTHTGIMWPIYFVKPIIRLFFPSLWLKKNIPCHK